MHRGRTGKKIQARSKWFLLLPFLSLSALLGAPLCRAGDAHDVVVSQEPPAISRKEFQPWNPFNQGPKLPPGQKALTQYAFNMKVRFDDLEIIDQEERHGRWFVHVKPKNAVVRLLLNITIWTPERAPKKCREHEEGHRIICEQVYSYAEEIVRYYAVEILKKNYYGEGATAELAQQDAYSLAASELNKDYRETVFDYAKAVSDEYDRLTAHGINEIAPQAAIQEAFAKCGREMIVRLEEKQKEKDSNTTGAADQDAAHENAANHQSSELDKKSK